MAGSILKIFAVARYEALTLWRSWFFRIFAGVLLALVALVNAIVFGAGQINAWAITAIPADIPYLTMLFVNIVQSVVAVILASDFIKRDRSLDTTDVVYIRSISNTAYVIGKAGGTLFVFVSLDLAALLVTGVFNYFAGGTGVRIAAYVYYPVILGLPTIAFCIGFSFFVMSLFKSQPLALLVLLGTLGLAFFFLPDTLFSIFDFAGLRAPLMISDFVGSGADTAAVGPRCMYLLLGFALVLVTGLRLKRLPQSAGADRIVVGISAALFVAVIAYGVLFVVDNLRDVSLRSAILALHDKYYGTKTVIVTGDDITLTHRGNSVSATARLVVRNPGVTPVDRYVLRLNPGLAIREVTGARVAGFERLHDLVVVRPKTPLAPRFLDTVSLAYEGGINDAACYLDIGADDIRRSASVFFLHRRSRFSCVNNGFLLLTPESGFYPRAGVGYSALHPECGDNDLTAFSVSVSTRPGLTVLCQGGGAKDQTAFRPKQPLPGVTIIAGPYVFSTLQVDSVECSLATLAHHDYYKRFFTGLSADTVVSLIRSVKSDFESRMKVAYPYKRFRLVEVPLQFADFPRLWTSGHESVQPEMMLVPENGFALTDADFGRMQTDNGSRRQREQETQTPQEMQSALFLRFASATFARDNEGRQIMLRPQDRNNVAAWALQWLPPVNCQASNLFAFPDYVSNVCAVHAPQCPLFVQALESYYKKRVSGAFAGSMRGMFTGATTDEKVNLLLSGGGFGDICKDERNRPLLRDVDRALGDYLFAVMQKNIPARDFDEFLTDMLRKNRFGTIDLDSLCSDVKIRYGFNLAPALASCYRKHRLPGYLVANVGATEVRDKNANRYLVRFDVENPESAEGLIRVNVRTGTFGGNRFGGGGNRAADGRFGSAGEERIISFGPHQSKEICMMMDNPPRMLAINTLISKNIPSTVTVAFDKVEFDEAGKAFDGERVVDSVQSVEPGAVVVDDQDGGFSVETRPASHVLEKIFAPPQSAERYAAMRFFDPPADWTQIAGPLFYGRYIRSAYYIKAGGGGKRIAWHATLRESGAYEIFAYYNVAGFRQGFGRRGGDEAAKGSFHYVVHYDDGDADVPLDLKDIQNGWNFLGRFHCSAGISVVELTDRADGQTFVVGDAVKWVKLP